MIILLRNLVLKQYFKYIINIYMDRKKIAQKLYNTLKENIPLAQSIFSKICMTLFETEHGLFYKRNYSIDSQTNLSIEGNNINIENILNNTYDIDIFQSALNMEKKYETQPGIEIKINTKDKEIIYIYLLIDKPKKPIINKDGHSIIILLATLNENIIEENNEENKDIHYYKDLLFNITKHKYVPYIELVNTEEILEKRLEKYPKIKSNDKLIKFYNFPVNSLCKIIYKTNKFNNKNLYHNYRLVI